ncbi:MAG: LPS-assembly protein LptD [Acidobacteriota bacterium]
MIHTRTIHLLFLILTLPLPGLAQQSESPEKRVENPIGVAEERARSLRRVLPSQVSIVATVSPSAPGTVVIDADQQNAQGSIVTAAGNVQVVYADILLIADLVTYDRDSGEIRAEGNVFFEQQGQRLTGQRLEMNARTRLGTIYTVTAFTNRTPDGSMLIVDAAEAVRTGERTFALRQAILTACQEARPKWSLKASRATIELDERARIYNALLRIKKVPVFYLPYASISISRKDRSSGFLLPGSGSSTLKGRTLNLAYYQTLGRSADILIRTDIFSKRGIGLGYDFRARTNDTSRVNFGSFLVFDRLFGQKGVNQGGSSFYADAIHRFKNGFVAVADVNITSSFAFRQIFAENIQTAISPEERSVFYLNKNWGAWSFNSFFGEQSSFIGDQIVKVRRLPSLELNRRSTRLIDSIPVYLSFDAALEGVRRNESRGDQLSLRTPSVVQRFDLSPRLTFPFRSIAGFTFTPSVALRSTFYSDRLDPVQQQVVGNNLLRNYVDLTADLRPPALARVFRHRNGAPWFKHIIEPFIEYRRIAGVDRFDQTLRVDERDIVASTNQVTYGVGNIFLVKRQQTEGAPPQPHELLNVSISQSYYFDPTFGGAMREGMRNQFFPINTLSGFAFGGLGRHASPLNLRARLRPTGELYADARVNYDTKLQSLRDIIVGGGIVRRLFSISQTWYFTRRVPIDQFRFDPTSLPGNQADVSAFFGNPSKGPYAGVNVSYDLRNRRFNNLPRDPKLLNFTTSVGWAWDCCSLNVQNVTFNVGLRNENRILFAFTFKGIGTFGTDTHGQRRPR